MRSKAKKSQDQSTNLQTNSEKSTTSFDILERNVLKWAEDRLIFDQSNTISQWCKLDEEHRELAKAIKVKDKVEVVDAIGDMMVVLTLIAHMEDVTLTTCYEYAWNEIKDRKGKMVNGVFVKE